MRRKVYTDSMTRRPAFLAIAVMIIAGAFHFTRYISKKCIEQLSGAGINLHGAPLKACSSAGMAATGYGRDGFCKDDASDSGSHRVCIDIGVGDANFCASTGQPNWCDGKDTCHDDENAKCPKRKWCVCQWAFDKLLQGTPCSELKIDCGATNMKALETFRRDPHKYSNALQCFREQCA